MSGRLREHLAEAAAQMPPARLTPDVWRRGRRARRRARIVVVLGAVLVLVALLGLGPVLVRDGVRPAGEGDAVPGDLSLPWFWQATVQLDPPGRASILYGGDTRGLHGSDLYDSEGKVAVVGRTGVTRMQLYFGADTILAGEQVMLSPDGTRVAQPFLEDPALPDGLDGLVVTDLTTGISRRYPGDGLPCCTPIAWSPDGRSVLASEQESRPVVLDLDTGRVRPLGGSVDTQRTASRGAFAPDGQHVAISYGTTLRVSDLSGQTQWTVDLGPSRYLAGVGAFSPDGTRVAIASLEGCLQDCDEAALAARRWHIDYLDAVTGRPTSGTRLATVTGSAVRALGWTDGGDLVALRYEPESGARKSAVTPWNDTGWIETGHVTLVALRPDGSTVTLLDPPDGVLTMDVAHDLLAAGRFGGPSSTASIFPARSNIRVLAVPFACVAVVLALALWPLVSRRRRERRFDRRPLGSRH